jgi:predicted AlkP superfamily pyrophosphatase or phosphodiesterase
LVQTRFGVGVQTEYKGRARLRIRSFMLPLVAVGALSSPLALGVERAAAGGQVQEASAPTAVPRLVVLIVVDQLRGDLLTAYGEAFEGGLARLADRGLRFVNATHDHAHTETSPGHASLSTGTFPSKHGMVRNVWWERSDGGWTQVFNVIDEEAPMLGRPDLAGGSPRRLERTGLADWLLEQSPGSRVVSLSAKDRAAVLLAGKSSDVVYWIEGSEGRFMTSTFYRSEDLPWVTRFNLEEMPARVGLPAWESEVPEVFRTLSRRDTVPYEADREHTHFTHFFLTPEEQAREAERSAALAAGAAEDTLEFVVGEAGPRATQPEWWDGYTPGPDAAVLALARVAVEEEDLGSDAAPDLLALSLSQLDRIGHRYGPMSRESLEILVHLDRELGAFLEYLDERMGPEGYLLAFSGDHGVLAIPEYLQETGRPGGRLARDAVDSLQSQINAAVRANSADGPDAVLRAMTEATRDQPWVADAWSRASLLAGETPDSFAVLARNSAHPDRPADVLSRFGVELRIQPNFLTWLWPNGTTHGSPYYYDRHVPLVLMGTGIQPGVREDRAATVDLAPTLARILNLQTPDDLDGRDLFGR